jgi:hypothetical protein
MVSRDRRTDAQAPARTGFELVPAIVACVVAFAALFGWRGRQIREVDVEVIPPDQGEQSKNGSQPVSQEAPPSASETVSVEVVPDEEDELEEEIRTEEPVQARVEAVEPPAPVADEEEPLEEEVSAEEPVQALVEAVEPPAPVADEEEPLEEEIDADEPVVAVEAPVPPPSSPEPSSEPHEATCEIAVWRGYREASFYARMYVDGQEVAVAESEKFRPSGKDDLEQSEVALAAHRALCEQLLKSGWVRTERGDEWYADGFGAKIKILRGLEPEDDTVLPGS